MNVATIILSSNCVHKIHEFLDFTDAHSWRQCRIIRWSILCVALGLGPWLTWLSLIYAWSMV